MKKIILVSMISILLGLSACTPAIPTQDAMTEKTSATGDMENTTIDLMGTPTEALDPVITEGLNGDETSLPAFFTTTLTNVNTGDTYMLSDFAGKVVLVENLAMWCSNCKKQQEQVKILHTALGSNSDLISIGFDVDPNEKEADLKKYTEVNGFDWVYSVPPQEVLNEISNLLGANFLNPPSTPIFIIDRKGGVHPMPFGIKSADDLQKFIDPFLVEGM